jgi:hypothetical protein
LHGHGPLDADLYAYDHKTHHHLLGRSTRNGSNESVTTVICGPAAIDVVVRRYSGSGSWRLDGSLP